MNYQYTTVPFAGLILDTFLTDDGRKWVTLSSVAKALNIHQQTVGNWIKAKAKVEYTLDVKVGKYNKAAKAYPTDMVVDFIDYLADKGNKECRALRTATLKADLDRTISEANGLIVTAEQHEEVRHSTRLAYLEQWVSENYKPVRAKDGTINVLKGDTIRAAGLDKNPTEYTIVNLLSQVAKREVQMTSGKMTEEELEMYREGNRRYQADIQKLSLSLA